MGTARVLGDGNDPNGRRGTAGNHAPPGIVAGDGHAHAVDPRRVAVIQEWECLVEEVGPETLYARLADVTCPSHEDEWCEIPLADVPADLMGEIEHGAIFRMLVVRDAVLATSLVLAPLVGPSVPDDTGARLAELLAGLAARASPEDKAWLARCRDGRGEER